MGVTSPVLRFTAWATVVVAWFLVGPRLPAVSLWWNVAIVSIAVIPGTLLLVLLALPLAERSWQLLVGATVAFALLAFAFSEAGWGLPANFAKLAAAAFAGFAFLKGFEELSWVVIVALVVPVVDAISVWHGPTHSITAHHFHVYTAVAVAFVLPGHRSAYLGPPDVLFYALFLAAALRWHLRVGWTWLATTGMYALTVVIATAVDVNGLPALPFLSTGFLLANGDLLWSRFRGRSAAA